MSTGDYGCTREAATVLCCHGWSLWPSKERGGGGVMGWVMGEAAGKPGGPDLFLIRLQLSAPWWMCVCVVKVDSSQVPGAEMIR